jgi:triosephosphate isomerase
MRCILARFQAKEIGIMRQPIVAGNWKMNGNSDTVRALTEQLQQFFNGYDIQVEAVVFPPYPYLPLVSQILVDSTANWGGQNLSEFDNGAYTGEVSAAMLKDFGCRYVLVGHSERRQFLGESSERTAQKVSAALEGGLIPILCVGETLVEREAGQAEAVVLKQILTVIEQMSADDLARVHFAYEPVWAIGTGLTATTDQAQAMHAHIRRTVADKDAKIANTTRILYGGSVKADNAAALMVMPDIDGLLVGGASLSAHDFGLICQAAESGNGK